MLSFNEIYFKHTFKDKRIFCYFISKICNWEYNNLYDHFIIIPTKNKKVVEGIYFGKKIYFIQFIIQKNYIQDKFNKEILEKEILHNYNVSKYTTQIDQIIQINFNLLKTDKKEIDEWHFKDENFIIPRNFYKIIILNLTQLLKSNNLEYKNLANLFLLNDKDKILEYIQKET